MNILALDVGLGFVKAAVLDAATGQAPSAIARTEYALDAPTADAVEIPAARLWDALAAAARQAVRQAGVAGRAGHDVAAVGLSTFGPALVLLGKDDQPLAPIWTPLDRRARSAARQVSAHVGAEFLASAGNRPLPGRISALSWRAQLSAEPYLSHRLRSYLHLGGWLAFHLTGQRVFDPANACFSGLYDTATTQTWSSRWCDYFEVDASWLPAVVPGDTTVGALRAAVAHELGVPAGLPVKLGTSDLASMVLGSRMEAGDLLHVEGTSQTLAVLADQPAPSPWRLTSQLGVGAAFVRSTLNPVGRAALDWVRRLCFAEQSAEEFWRDTLPRARERRTRVSLDPPFLAGDALEVESQRAALRDLELTTDRMDVLAAVAAATVRRQREARAHLGMGETFRRVFLAGATAAALREIVPDYREAQIDELADGALRGVARLFVP